MLLKNPDGKEKCNNQYKNYGNISTYWNARNVGKIKKEKYKVVERKYKSYKKELKCSSRRVETDCLRPPTLRGMIKELNSIGSKDCSNKIKKSVPTVEWKT